jgi:hypothetical protein
MTLITRKKLVEEAQTQRQEVRQLREFLEGIRRQSTTDRMSIEKHCTARGTALAGRPQLVRRDGN